MKPSGRRGEFGLLQTLGVFIAAALLQWAGLLTPIDNLITDHYQRMRPGQDTNNVLLVHTDKDFDYLRDLPKLVEYLDERRAQVIGILPGRTQLSAEYLQNLPANDRVVVGSEFEFWIQDHLPNHGWQQGFAELQLSDQTIYRHHVGATEYQQQPCEAFESLLARQAVLAGSSIPQGKFAIRFRGGKNSLPHITAEECLSGYGIEEMISNRVVLIGEATNEPYGFATPTTIRSERMGRLELHGQILQSILNGDTIQIASSRTTFILLALMSLLACQFFRQLPTSSTHKLLLTLIVLNGLMGWVSFQIFSYQIPLIGMLIVTLLSWFGATIQRISLLESTSDLWRLTCKLNEQFESAYSKSDSDPWDLLRDAVFQMFYPQRMALMELKPGASHLQVLRTINCTEEAIFERRRDVQREPYSLAIETGKPLTPEYRTFFTQEKRELEREFVCPLIFASELVGFMVLAMDSKEIEKWQNFESFLAQFTYEMAILIAKDRKSKTKVSRFQQLLKRLRSVPEQKIEVMMREAESVRQENVQRLHRAFENSESAMAVCDAFGRVLRTNSQLIQLLQRSQIALQETTCVDLIAKLTQRPIREARRVIRKVVNDKRSEQIYLPANESRKHPSVLHVKPLATSLEEVNNEMAARRIIIEIVEGEVFEQVTQWQSQLTDKICETANQQILGLQQKVDALSELDDPGSLSQLFGSLGSTVSEIVGALDQSQAIARNRISEDPLDRFPLGTRSILQSALTKHESHFEIREIEVQNHVSENELSAIANPFLLEKVFLSIFDMLLKNAFDGSQVQITADNADNRLVYCFRNLGGGTSLQTLRKSLKSESACEITEATNEKEYFTQDQIDQLREIRGWLESWNGNLRLVCRSDYGLVIELSLMVFAGADVEADLMGASDA